MLVKVFVFCTRYMAQWAPTLWMLKKEDRSDLPKSCSSLSPALEIQHCPEARLSDTTLHPMVQHRKVSKY